MTCAEMQKGPWWNVTGCAALCQDGSFLPQPLTAPLSSFSSSPCFSCPLCCSPSQAALSYLFHIHTHPTVLCVCSMQTKRQLNLPDELRHLFSSHEGLESEKGGETSPFSLLKLSSSWSGNEQKKILYKWVFILHVHMLTKWPFILRYEIKVRFSSSSLTRDCLHHPFKHILLSGTFLASHQHLFKDKDANK